MGILQKFKCIRQKSNSHLLHFEDQYLDRQDTLAMFLELAEDSSVEG